jgi:hypothetical protein
VALCAQQPATGHWRLALAANMVSGARVLCAGAVLAALAAAHVGAEGPSTALGWVVAAAWRVAAVWGLAVPSPAMLWAAGVREVWKAVYTIAALFILAGAWAAGSGLYEFVRRRMYTTFELRGGQGDDPCSWVLQWMNKHSVDTAARLDAGEKTETSQAPRRVELSLRREGEHYPLQPHRSATPVAVACPTTAEQQARGAPPRVEFWYRRRNLKHPTGTIH